MKKIIYLVAAFLCLSCSDDHEFEPTERRSVGQCGRSNSGDIGLMRGTDNRQGFL